MFVTKSASDAKHLIYGGEEVLKAMRKKRLRSHRRRVREDLDDMRRLYNAGELDLMEMDFVHQKKKSELATSRDVV